jgi:hypothetical protein
MAPLSLLRSKIFLNYAPGFAKDMSDFPETLDE